MATGSYPWVPPINGNNSPDCFVYRTIEDLNAIEACARLSRKGRLLAAAVRFRSRWCAKSLGIETHVIEFAPTLMAEQLDSMGGEQLKRKIERMGVKVHTAKTPAILSTGKMRVKHYSLPMAPHLRLILSYFQPVYVRKIN